MAYEDDIALRDRFLTLLDQVRYGRVPPPLAIQARKAWEATDTFKKEQQAIQEKTDAINSLKSQVLDQWKQLGVPSIGGGLSIDERAQGLAERLYANQITDLAKLGLGTGTQLESAGYVGDFEVQKEVPVSYLTYDGRQIGFLGDIGTAENWQPTGYLQQGNLASWGAQGKGAVGYSVQQAPNGQVYFIPSWGSTSDVSTIAPIAAIGLGLLAPGIGNAIGAALAPAASAAVQAAIGSAVIGGTMAEASGGDFLTGALTGAAGSALSPVTSAISETVGSEALGRALTSGAMAEATGGDFTQAALTGALTGAINEAKLAAAEDYINSIAPGTSYEADLPTSQDVLNVIAAEQPSYQVSDTTFTPDYSLNIGAPVVQDMGVQGIQVPTINEVIDIVNQPVDYSLQIPETNLNIVMPTVPNIDSMGGQGITALVSGGTLTESGVIPETYVPEQPSYQISDTTFTPDYSLSTGAPVIPEMGAQGIQVPTINEVIDILDGVDYSIPIPDSGIGLVMPTAPNLESMGGAQGVTIPVSGGTLTEVGVIPETYIPVLGDETSFINQPAPDVSVNIPEVIEQPKDISGQLAALDVAKALVPLAVGALTAGSVVNAIQEDQPTGFEIVPIPSEWKSPEYNMAFTPSAPIDFGSRELLRGTQWENPQIQSPKQYSISDVINALNYQSAPFVQQNYQIPQAQMVVPDILEQFNIKPTVGVNDIIGNLGNRPVSIADIISGIQSGQNYSS